MTSRRWNGITQTLSYDAENRLTGVSVDGSGAASFVYDGEGNRVKGTVSVTTTLYMGTWYEWSGSAGTSYYYFGGQRVALRANSQTSYIHGDHLTSATNTTGSQTSGSQRYYPYGETRGSTTVVTPYRYTGQREETGIGLYFYNARWYDPALGRFIQPDTLVPEPGNVQTYNRYCYVLNNPLKYVDPTGHDVGVVWKYHTMSFFDDYPPLRWPNQWVPSIRDVRPGGFYSQGEMDLGGISVGLYVPPDAWCFPNDPSNHPLYDPNVTVMVAEGSYHADYWYGGVAVCGPLAPGKKEPVWKIVEVRFGTDAPSLEEFGLGFCEGLAGQREDLPLGPGATPAEASVSGASTLFGGLQGGLGKGRNSAYILQTDHQGHFRLIVLSREMNSTQVQYRTFDGFVPCNLDRTDPQLSKWGIKKQLQIQ